MDIQSKAILIVDFGSQYTQLIARRVRELGVYSEVYPYDNVQDLELGSFAGLILSGGPESVNQPDAPAIDEQLLNAGIPILGICYGMQALAAQLGGEVASANQSEFGYARISVQKASCLIGDLNDQSDPEPDAAQVLDVWMSHGDKVTRLPKGFECILSTDSCPIAGIACEEKAIYGIQFHPEVTHTLQGEALLTRFIYELCQCESNWTPENIVENAIARIREQVGDESVLLGLSGGVDSSVTAALVERAIGDQLVCVFVDNGLLRKGEGDQVMAQFQDQRGLRIIRVNAEDEFLSALSGVSDPEKKRKVIGNTFIDLFDREAARLSQDGQSDGTKVTWLAQGTIYPDVIESAGSKNGKAHVIKSHHNVGGLPEHMSLKLLEPLRDLFKDEVRKIGLELGLPEQMVFRHPFPGPGLGVRILGEIKKHYADILREADAIFIEELYRADLYQKVSQAFAVFLPVKSVGVVGDGRRYAYVVSLRAVETLDFMTARWAHLPYDFIEKVSTRIMNEIEGVSRVVYDVSSKPPSTIEWE